jgi:hypothetical protein
METGASPFGLDLCRLPDLGSIGLPQDGYLESMPMLISWSQVPGAGATFDPYSLVYDELPIIHHCHPTDPACEEP